MSTLRFISIDPSSTVTGWAIFQGESLITWGKIDVAKVEYGSRFARIVSGIAEAYMNYRFEAIVIEDVRFAWHSKNRNRNIAGLQVAYKSIQDYAKTSGFPITAINPATWKNAVVGHRAASKEITKNNIRLRFQSIPDDLTSHEYDAIAIGVYHAGVRKLEAMA
jgi:Holliday junction resolvasome RuvABC endonuclease subunit